MGITSLSFFVFLILSVIVYYIFPKKLRWIILLVSSIIFFLYSCSCMLLGYMLFGVITTYIGARLIEKIKNQKGKRIILLITLISIIGELAILKYINIIPGTINAFSSIFNININMKTFNLLAPLGISYYTLSLTAYTVDVYRTTSNAEKNIFKHLLFTCYYPLMISGPVVRYEEMKKELYSVKKFQITNIIYGTERIIYGLLKKMVIADQLSIVIKVIFDNYAVYSGLYLIVGVVLYAIQIYADFSGCMDIVIGASKMYDVTLPENFNAPFFSRNLSEFWRRWHITLGTWGKDYIMYPLLMSKSFQRLGTFCKKKFGKKIGKKIPTTIAIFILWLIIGFWHGASYKYIFAAGIIPWLYLTISEFCEPLFVKLKEKININYNNFSYRLFESIRTLSLMCLIWLFARASSFLSGFDVLRSVFVYSDINLRLQLPIIPTNIIFLALILVFIVDYLKYKNINVLEKFNEQNLIFKYIVIFGMLSLIIIYGAYGPGYNAVDFIYGGF